MGLVMDSQRLSYNQNETQCEIVKVNAARPRPEDASLADSNSFRDVDYKVLRVSTDSLSPLRNIPPPEQNSETRGTNIKTGPFVRAESGKDAIADNEKGGD
jgi:hypothetical protein